MTKKEISRCILFGGFKFYRKYKGGHWSKVIGFPYYWINRKPYWFEEELGHVLATEEYPSARKRPMSPYIAELFERSDRAIKELKRKE
jgi:hypothetical protein